MLMKNTLVFFLLRKTQFVSGLQILKSYIWDIYGEVKDNYKFIISDLHVLTSSHLLMILCFYWSNWVLHKFDPFFLGGVRMSISISGKKLLSRGLYNKLLRTSMSSQIENNEVLKE